MSRSITDLLSSAAWEDLTAWLPHDLDALAAKSGGFQRRRAIQSPLDFIRLALAYGLLDLSLRSAAAWSADHGLGQLSDVAVLGRLRRGWPFLEAVFQAMLTRQVAARRPAGLVFDAAPGVGQVRRSIFGDTLMVERPKTAGGYEAKRNGNGWGVLQEERQTLHVVDDQLRVRVIEAVTSRCSMGTPTPRVRYALDEELVSAMLAADGDSGVSRDEEVHPYGTTAWWAEDAAIEVSRKRVWYSGKERDEETGLLVHSARTYAPWLGRWDWPDPIGLRDGGNRWGYV
ncbi:RHS repeat-associated core domain-containing protein, partial [Myxococcota bacterium]|nr:RHS repeat-associated core domain-containing protein [Myxococcota bacterium]